jgi:hypothetical protein
MRQQAAPAALIALPLPELLPVRVDDRDGGACPVRGERDLDAGGVGEVLAQVPAVDEPPRRLPLEDLAPVVLLAGRRALEDAAAGAGLERHGQVRVGGTEWDFGHHNEGRCVNTAETDPKRAHPIKVTEFEPGRRMVWTGGENGATRFHMREEFTGPMLPLIWKSMPDLGPSFDRFARGLKARAEAGA